MNIALSHKNVYVDARLVLIVATECWPQGDGYISRLRFTVL